MGLFSVSEGDDKPAKYPAIFSRAAVVLINKIDLLPYVPFRMDFFRSGVEALNPGVITFPLSCRTSEGLADWADWLVARVRQAGHGGSAAG